MDLLILGRQLEPQMNFFCYSVRLQKLCTSSHMQSKMLKINLYLFNHQLNAKESMVWSPLFIFIIWSFNHLGNDKRHYILDLQKSFPPDVNFLPPVEPKETKDSKDEDTPENKERKKKFSSWESKLSDECMKMGFPRSHRHRLLTHRPELVDAFVENRSAASVWAMWSLTESLQVPDVCLPLFHNYYVTSRRSQVIKWWKRWSIHAIYRLLNSRCFIIFSKLVA